MRAAAILIYVCVYAFIYVSMCVCVHVCMNAYMFVCMYICMYIGAGHLCVCMYVCIYQSKKQHICSGMLVASWGKAREEIGSSLRCDLLRNNAASSNCRASLAMATAEPSANRQRVVCSFPQHATTCHCMPSHSLHSIACHNMPSRVIACHAIARHANPPPITHVYIRIYDSLWRT